MKNKIETRIIPENTTRKFYMQHLKPYDHIKNLVTGKKVLEIGSGDGYGSHFLRQYAKEVVGIDYDTSVVKVAQSKYSASNLSFKCMSATELEFEDNSFDVACSFQVIEHIPPEDMSNYLTSIKRILKADGKFYVTTLNLDRSMKSAETYQKNPAHTKEFVLKELQDLLEKYFKNVQMLGVFETPTHLFYQRLKKIGLFKKFPDWLNPVKHYYERITTRDLCISPNNLTKCIDFFCICS